MRESYYRMLFLLVLGLITTGCAPASPQGGDAQPAAPPKTPVTSIPAVDVPPADVAYGRNDDGTFYQGAADAPVTLIDYSDFL